MMGWTIIATILWTAPIQTVWVILLAIHVFRLQKIVLMGRTMIVIILWTAPIQTAMIILLVIPLAWILEQDALLTQTAARVTAEVNADRS